MQAIQTKYVGPTNYRGTRIIARADAGRIVHNYDYALGDMGNHEAAAKALAEQLGWAGDWTGGNIPDGSVVWTCHVGRTFNVA